MFPSSACAILPLPETWGNGFGVGLPGKTTCPIPLRNWATRRISIAEEVEVIDHHPGYEQYWAQRLGSAADIQPIGAAVTQVFQRWDKADLLLKISQQSAALLATAILDNTLNFTGQMTTAQDVQAYAVLARLVNSSMLRKELLKLGLCAGHQGAPNTIVQ